MSVRRRLLAFAAVLALGLVAAMQPASARHWRETPAAAALQYSQIIDRRDEHNMYVVWWLTAQSFPEEQAFADILKGHVFVGVAHVNITSTGDITFETTTAPAVQDTAGKALKLVKEGDQPASVATVVAAFQVMMPRVIGPMGKGITLYVYDRGTVDACKTGKVSIPIDGEVYTYDTPIPGCPKP